MVLKVIDATEMKIGTVLMIENSACTVKTMDISKTGKHGHAKVRFEAIGVLDGKKRVVVVPGHERFEVPMIDKKKGQILSVVNDRASIMDLESFETLEVPIDPEVTGLNESDNVEYWDVEGSKIIKRKA